MKNSSLQDCILHLSLIDGIGPATVQAIVERGKRNDSWQDVYRLRTADWMYQFGFSEKVADKLISGLADTQLLDQEKQLIEKYKINWTTYLSGDYPYFLKQIHLPPPVLYWQGGALQDQQKRLAFVGSRKAHHYGQQVIDTIVPALVAHDWVIVSGGAVGIDSMSHEAAVRAGGKTIAVFGSGLLRPYPLANKRLFASIVASDGILMSPFPLRMQAMSGNFPARNRIIAGLSKGCVVVQAAAKSGARITAQYALEQGRDVFAVPGPIDDELSAGCHALIQEGAKLVAKPEDILSEYGEQLERAPVHKNMHKNEFADAIKNRPNKVPDGPQGHIIRACKQACSIDELAQKTGLKLSELQDMLFKMQLEGAIRQDFTGMWICN